MRIMFNTRLPQGVTIPSPWVPVLIFTTRSRHTHLHPLPETFKVHRMRASAAQLMARAALARHFAPVFLYVE